MLFTLPKYFSVCCRRVAKKRGELFYWRGDGTESQKIQIHLRIGKDLLCDPELGTCSLSVFECSAWDITWSDFHGGWTSASVSEVLQYSSENQAPKFYHIFVVGSKDGEADTL